MATHRKTTPTDIDSKRLPSFLLGIILALSVLYVALEYTSPAASDIGADLFDDLFQDMELPDIAEPNDMIPAEQLKKEVSTNIKAVESAPATVPDETTTSAITAVQGEEPAASEEPEATQALPQVQTEDDPISFRIVEQIPQFEGGMEAFTKWLTQNLCYPVEAQKKRIEGKVVVSFVINRDGSISSPKIEKPVHPLLDREALRVINLMPKWTPGKENDKPCRTLFAIPIVFQL